MQISLDKIGARRYDLCVVGSGPAGIITALEYQRLRPEASILLVEYGDGKSLRNALDDSIDNVNPANHHPPYECTNKGMGGTSKTWGGRCVLYDEIDFLPREIIGDTCTWNLQIFASVLEHTRRTAEYFDCGDPVFNLNQMADHANRRIAAGFVEGDVLDSPLERWSLPTRFGPKYAAEIAAAPNLFYVLDCQAIQLNPRSAAERDCSLEVRSVTTGETQCVLAANIVLAAGTQETTRLLLRSPAIFAHRGGAPDALGRYYQGHISGKIASVKFYNSPRDTDYGFVRDREGVYLRRRFQFPTEVLQKHNLLNTAFWLDNPLYFDPSHRSGTLSFIYLMMLMPILGKRLAPPAIAHSVTKGKANRIGSHLFNILRGLPKSVLEPASVFSQRYFGQRRLPGVFFYNPDNTYALHFHAEQVPTSEHRMELADDGETLKITYGYTEADVASVIRAHELLDAWLRKCGCGELVYWYPRAELPAAIRANSQDGVHQVGTLRMSLEPERGVVDPDLRVWGTENLYVCSSGIFPTSGQANPTFMLGAFAVRLANHLAKQG
jgi:hypothetical protein